MKKIECDQKNTKVGDKVKIYKNHTNFSWFCNWYHGRGMYAETNLSHMECMEFLVTGTDQQYLWIENKLGVEGGWNFEMFYKEEANEMTEETDQNKFEVLKWIYEGQKIEYRNPVASGQYWDEVKGQWMNITSQWVDLDTSGNFSFFETFEYRIKPVVEPEKFQFLIFAKGKYVVTSKKYEDEASVKLGYSYPIEVIQKLENRKIDKST